MDNFKVLVRIAIVKCTLTAEQWGLFTATKDCSAAARQLNTAVQVSARAANTRAQFISAMRAVMSSLREFGASDTEPEEVMLCIADELFPEPDVHS